MSVRDVVAIVDDEPLVVRALQRILAPEDHGVVAVTRSEDLDPLMAEPRLAVVLLDLFMEGVCALDRIEAIRRDRPDVQVVVMTGRPCIDSAVRCIRAGAFEYLCKPFTDLHRVREIVRAARASLGAGQAGVSLAPGSDWVRVPLVGERIEWPGVPLSLDAYERLALERALREAAGDAADAARRLDIGRSTFYRKAAKHGLELRRIEGRTTAAESDGRGTPRTRVGEGPSIR